MVHTDLKYLLRTASAAAVIAAAGPAQIVNATELGRTVTNIASMTYIGDGGPVTVVTPPAEFVIEAARTESTIEFFRYSPNAPDAQMHQINGSDFSASNNLNGPFTAMDLPNSAAAASIGNSPMPLIPASTYSTGEVMYVRVTDLGQNGDPNVIETIAATVTASNGDSITLRLYESGPDTGEFWAYIPSVRDETPAGDAALTTGQGTLLTATYIDSFDSTEVSVDTALVDPYGRVFNGLTGELINGAIVTVHDAATGQPAPVYGVDGFSAYPSSVVTGSIVSDASGLQYNLRAGEFRFPLMPLGDYYVTVQTPSGLTFASILQPSAFTSLPNAPYVIENQASYGLNFTLDGSGPLNFDIPLDARTDFTLNKVASVEAADVGDFVGYTVEIQNSGPAGAPVRLRDTMPAGFSYVSGSATLGGQPFSDPQLSGDGQVMTFDLGALPSGGTRELNYVLRVGAGADAQPGRTAVNDIVAIDFSGAPISNVAQASIVFREDLLRSRSTIIGRISERSCDVEEDWAREIYRGDGVSGVRLYMETGDYVLSDEDGLFHFEGVTEGTHVVQVDEETLPDGYEIMTCEESSRYAGRGNSKFVDVQGGSIWRANFYLRRTGELSAQEVEAEFNDQLEYKDYDGDWLDVQSPDFEWVYPAPHRTPSIPSVNIGIKHHPDQKVRLSLNGFPVSMKNFEARESNSARTAMLSRWRGVDILEGRNVFTADLLDTDGKVIKTTTKDIHYVTDIVRAHGLSDQSVLVADGRTNPVLAIRMEDEAGRPVHAGRIAQVDIPAPYRLYNDDRLLGEAELVSSLSARANVTVGADGIAKIKLAPTLRTGKVTIRIKLHSGRIVEQYMYLEPEKRDWIVVGLAEGSLAYENIKNASAPLARGSSDDLIGDGRVAFFAKGLVKGEWLMTLAVDTDKRRGNRDKAFQGDIDPNAYYTLYGDRSYQESDAASRYPVYVKLEKKNFYAMFGDYDTNITEGKLTRYSRNLSGFKAEYLDEKFLAIGYAAETNQGFTKDEIAADGTSGAYQLSNRFVLVNSETITIETRDRVRPDKILDRKTMIRHLDYRIDYLNGNVIFKLPVDATDALFNPNVIVVDYETSEDSERNVSFGGRLQRRFMGGRVQIGSTFVHEGGNGNAVNAKSDMIGGELIADIDEHTEFRAEYAMSSTDSGVPGSPRTTANAYLAEIVHTSEDLTAEAFVRQEEGGFGLNQRSTTNADIRRYGAQADYRFQQLGDDNVKDRGSRHVAARLYKEENLGTGDTRTSAEVNVRQDGRIFSASGGLRQVKDKIVGQDERESLLATAAVSYTSPKHGATFSLAHEQPLGSKGEVTDHPQRTRLSLDKTITDKAVIRISHDILDGENEGGQNTAIGVSYSPWARTEVTAGTDRITSDAGQRIGATVAVDQQIRLSKKWSASVGVSSRRILDANGTRETPAGDGPLSPFETNENSNAGYVGVGYRTEATVASARLEARETESSDALILTVGGAREMSETLSFAGAVRTTAKQERGFAVPPASDGKSSRIDARIGIAYRPRDEGIVVLNRSDVIVDKAISGVDTTKLINNTAINAQITDRWQLSSNYGLKYVDTAIGTNNFSGVTHLVGGETRWDLTERIDLGLHGSALFTEGGQTQYSFGPSIGVSPVDNVWISLGYNFDGYSDSDFSAAEYNRHGAYIKFRFKFDQNTARGLLDMISPKSVQSVDHVELRAASNRLEALRDRVETFIKE